ncbi:hypothetical protein ASPTUDRAFT_44322 [Aspergillus tubingensis CBS 134.48]|uniref:Uncharacterized protein n=1 Tax=Aspergillus tubingensis (strain CBS 134.48) TaxID=767770 RepID=A0A1L9N165_ASPTC|nr:hypothetical protein ASPTUDRAFT_44322 [Aspergillus tubingensis CBS 134.48]
MAGIDHSSNKAHPLSHLLLLAYLNTKLIYPNPNTQIPQHIMCHRSWKRGKYDTPNPWAWNGGFPYGGSHNSFSWNNNTGNTTSTNCGNTTSENCGNTTTNYNSSRNVTTWTDTATAYHYNNSGNKTTRTGDISANGGNASKGGATGGRSGLDFFQRVSAIRLYCIATAC